MKFKSLFLALALGLIVQGSAHAANLLTGSSAGATSISADGSSFGPILSADGQRLFFFSHAGNITSNQPLSDSLQLFVRDLAASNTTRVNILSNRWPSDVDVTRLSITSNGQFIAFASEANHPALGDTNFASDVFVHDVVSNVTRLVSLDWVGNPLFYSVPTGTNPLAANPIISADGRWIFFESIATSLTYENAWDNNNAVDVFRRDRQNNRTTLVTRNLSGFPQAANAASKLAAITPDGQHVAFLSSATDLVSEPSSGQEHVYLRDMVASNTVRVTVELTNYFSPYRFTNVRLSDDGRFVLFAVESYGWTEAIYLRDLQAAMPVPIATNSWNSESYLSLLTSPQLSADGRFVLYQVGGTNIFRFDTTTSTNELVSVELSQIPFINGGARDGVMTPDGNWILFNSDSPDLTTNNAAGWHLYARDMSAGTTRLVIVATNGQPSASQRLPVLFSTTPDISRVAFDSTATDLVAGDENRASDIFLRDLSSGLTELVTRRVPNLQRATGSGHAFINSDCISADGRFVAFTSYDNDMWPGDTNGQPDVFIRDLQTGTLTTPGFSTNAARSPTISANGRYVVYQRRQMLYPYAANVSIYRFDRETSTEELVATNLFISGVALEGSPVISSNGNLVAFLAGNNLVVRDMAAASNHVVGPALPWSGRDGTFTPDGARVLFVSTAALTPNAGSGNNLYVWNVAQRQIQLVSHDGSQNLGVSRSFVVSGNSRYVAFNRSDFYPDLYLHDLLAGTNTVLRQSAVRPAINADGSLVACVPLDSAYLVLLNTKNGEAKNIATNSLFSTPLLSPDGRLLVYGERRYTGDWGLAPNGQYTYFTTYNFPLLGRDLWFGTNLPISRAFSETNVSGPAWTAAMARDGRTVVFHSAASDLAPGDYNNKLDVFAFQLGGGDSDADGLDDDWEVAYFENLSRDGSGDLDGDGASDRTEFFSNTDPTNEGSVFRVVKVTSVNTTERRIFWTGNPKLTYRVEYKADLGSATWHVLEGSISWDGNTASTTDHGATSPRFYRAVRMP